FDGIDVPGEVREERSLISASRPYLEHAIARPDLQCLEVERLKRWLRCRLTEADRHRRILVRPVPHRFRDEEMTGYEIEHAQDLEIVDATLADRLDQLSPLPLVAAIAQSVRSQSRRPSSRR